MITFFVYSKKFCIFIKIQKIVKSIRLNREKKIDNGTFKVKIGTTNKENPQVIYVDGRVFLSPLEVMDNYTDEIEDIRKNFKRTIGERLRTNSIFDNRFILNFDISSSRMIKDKRSFLTFQFFLRQKNTTPMKLSAVKEKSEVFINGLLSSLEGDIESHCFTLHKTRK